MLALMLSGGLSGAVPAALAAGVCPTSESDLQGEISAAGAGGTVTLSCSSATTISFSPSATGTTGNTGTGTITLSQSVTLDASSSPQPITFDGNKDTQLFIVNSGVSFALNHLTLQNGSAVGSAGSDGTNPGNGGVGSGGAISSSGSVRITSSLLSGNTASGGNGGSGGVGGSFGNGGSGGGGAISSNGTLTITDSTFSGNSAEGGNGGTGDTGGDGLSGGGGAIASGGTLTVTDSTFSSNSAQGGSGGYGSQQGGNGGIGLGGAIASSGTLTITDSTMSGNTAQGGNAGNGVNAGQAGSALGGAIDGAGGTVVVAGSIVGNSPSGGNCSGTITDGGYDLTDDSSCFGSGPFTTGTSVVNSSSDLGLDPNGLQKNGGPAQTIALLSNSPAIDQIPTSATYTDPISTTSKPICQSTDERGLPRPDGSESNCDIGAYEYQDTIDLGPSSLPAGRCPTYSDLTTSLTEVGSGGTVTLECDTADTINFSPSASPTPGGGTITIAKSVTLDASRSTGAIAFDGGNTGASSSPNGVELFRVNSGVNVQLDALTLQNGSTTANGGAVSNSGTLTISNSTLKDNVANCGDSCLSFGGAIYSTGDLTISKSTFSGNAGSFAGSGGAIYGPSGNLGITDSTFSSNSIGPTGSGSAITLPSGSTATITGSLFSGNSGSRQGTIENGGQLTVTSSTFANNQLAASTNGGGAIANDGVAVVTATTITGNAYALINEKQLTLGGDIIATNPGGNCLSDSRAGASVTDLGYNLTDGSGNESVGVFSGCGLSAASHDLIYTDPKLDPNGLQDNGGPTQTIAVLPNSPAVDAIPPSTNLCPSTDQRGKPRPGDTTSANPNGNCDIGAYEGQNPLSFTVNASMTYGGSVPTLAGLTASDPSVTVTGDFNGDTLSAVTGTTSGCVTTATSSSPAGAYPITGCSGFSATGHDIFFTGGTLTINPAPLIISGSSPTITFSNPAPAITPVYSGLRNGDPAPATPPSSCSTTYIIGDPVGFYPSSCSQDASDPNYAISYSDGTVTVNKAPLADSLSFTPPSTVVKGGSLTLSATLTSSGSGVNGQNVTFTLAPL
ncbi:MAG TPA: choice-of-anchor Q domain-containing protein, partial [Chloroflexota bacterium]|nr:choice-of-anchor Q domain-containing protein [Chloroflexota bacterium]